VTFLSGEEEVMPWDCHVKYQLPLKSEQNGTLFFWEGLKGLISTSPPLTSS
jgi:hypothetical protein